MQWPDIEANWTQLKGVIKQTWGKITDDDLAEIEGKRDRMIGKLQELYDVDYDHAEAMVTDGLSHINIQGEGNYEAGKHYQDAQHDFAKRYTGEDKGKSS